MDWIVVASIVLAAWAVVALPVGILVGKALGESDRRREQPCVCPACEHDRVKS